MKVRLGNYRKNDHRKIDVNIEKFDTWSLDHSLAFIILPALLQLKATKHGIPGEFVSDIGGADYDTQDSFDFYKESHSEAFDIACRRWDDVLDKMIWSFQQIVFDDWESQYYHGEPKYDHIKEESPTLNPVTGQYEYMYRMVDTNPNEHWTDFDGMRLHEERIQEGLELFGKYYKHLWD